MVLIKAAINRLYMRDQDMGLLQSEILEKLDMIVDQQSEIIKILRRRPRRLDLRDATNSLWVKLGLLAAMVVGSGMSLKEAISLLGG